MPGPANNLILILLCLLTNGCVTGNRYRDSGTAAENKAIGFLQREVPAWSKENGCFSCHNNGDAARALYAATRHGHRVAAGSLADTTAWVLQPQRWEHNQGDPGFSDQRLANLQFAASLLAVVDAGYTGEREILRVAAGKVAADQSPDGSWAIEPGNAIGSPATYGTTLATCLAWRLLKQADTPETGATMQRAGNWLRRAAIDNVLCAATILLALATDSTVPARLRREECWNLLRRAQTADGGWGPYPDSPPEPFDTAIVLLALAEIRNVPGVQDLIRRGRGFLIAQQLADGSWPATTRPPGGRSYAQRLSTTGWATQALLATKDRTRKPDPQ